MPYQIQIIADQEYIICKDSYWYTLYYDIKHLFTSQKTSSIVNSLSIVNSDEEAIYNTLEFLVKNNYGDLNFNTFRHLTEKNCYGEIEQQFIKQLDHEYNPYYGDDYYNSQYLSFLVNQVTNIQELDLICKKYADDSYLNQWFIEIDISE